MGTISCLQCRDKEFKIVSRETQIANLTNLLFKIRQAIIMLYNGEASYDDKTMLEAIIQEINQTIGE